MNMKKYMMMALAVVLTACEKMEFSEDETGQESATTVDATKTKKFAFTVKGDFTDTWKPLTRGYLSADGRDMTDLWVLDYMDGVLVQQLHQSDNTAEDFGKPVLLLAYGSHHVYFVASRGASPVLDTDAHTLTFGTVRDTFWKDYAVDVVSTSNGNRSVTLDRVVAKLRVTATDEVPSGVATFSVTPATWYYGLNYMTGEPAAAASWQAVSVAVPASYVGTSGELSVSVFCFSSATEWTTDVTLDAVDGDNVTVGHGVIKDVPMKRNRLSDYSGPMFGTGGTAALSLDTEWMDSVSGTW